MVSDKGLEKAKALFLVGLESMTCGSIVKCFN